MTRIAQMTALILAHFIASIAGCQERYANDLRILIETHRNSMFRAKLTGEQQQKNPCMDRAAGSPSWLFMRHGLETVRNKVVGKGILHSAPCDWVTNGFLAALRSE